MISLSQVSVSFRQPTEDTPTAVAVVTDSQSAAQTLDEILAEGPYITAEEWETGEKIGGTTSAQYGGWDTRGAHQQ